MSTDDAEARLESWGFIRIGHQKLDVHRHSRTGVPEVIYGKGKTLAQLDEVVEAAAERAMRLLITRLDGDVAAELGRRHPMLRLDAASGLAELGEPHPAARGRVAVVSAGASDLRVAEEAAGTLAHFGIETMRAYDCGVAGLHRLFAHGDEIASADVIIVVAGMDGALPSVVAGVFPRPVIAVPTSVGYGAAFEGLSALLTMMNSCAPGVTVVNIDNGFGAAVAARAMLAMNETRS
ncbi:MAG: nickel pincer cofactor biosynthesis protein LarB [Acidobacteria bacterium]|nr:nickel pincer cofactor biosynthesis protein LarB [Acidobacteriota bacterium]